MALRTLALALLLGTYACVCQADLVNVYETDDKTKVTAPLTKVVVQKQADGTSSVKVDAPFTKVQDDKVKVQVPLIAKVDVSDEGGTRVSAMGVSVNVDKDGYGMVNVPFIGTFPVKPRAPRAPREPRAPRPSRRDRQQQQSAVSPVDDSEEDDDEDNNRRRSLLVAAAARKLLRAL